LLGHNVQRVETVLSANKWTTVGVIHQPKNFSAESEMAKPWEHSLSAAHHLCLKPSPEDEESSMIFESVVMAENFKGRIFVGIHD